MDLILLAPKSYSARVGVEPDFPKQR